MDVLRKKDWLGQNKPETKQLLKESLFSKRELAEFSSYAEAYHQLISDIITQQFASTQLVLKGSIVKRIFVDGGFGKNAVYMNLLALAFPELEVFAASMSQATAVGTALAIHNSWNRKPLPNDIIELKYFSAINPVT
jgi:ribulose kinase